jgi:hypothetical protein
LGIARIEIEILARFSPFYHGAKIIFTLYNPGHFFLHSNTNISVTTSHVAVDTPNEESKEESPELSNDEPIEPIEAPVKKKRAPRKKTILQTADPYMSRSKSNLENRVQKGSESSSTKRTSQKRRS